MSRNNNHWIANSNVCEERLVSLCSAGELTSICALHRSSYLIFPLIVSISAVKDSEMAEREHHTNIWIRVPKIQSYVNNFAHLEFPIERLNEVTKKLVEPCSSDAYVLVNHPGLTLEDLQDPSSFTFLRTYMLMSSTLGAIPRAEKPIDFEKLEMFANSRCGVLSVEVNGLQEAPTYIDTRTRFIKVNLPRLPDDPMMRKEALLAAGK